MWLGTHHILFMLAYPQKRPKLVFLRLSNKHRICHSHTTVPPHSIYHIHTITLRASGPRPCEGRALPVVLSQFPKRRADGRPYPLPIVDARGRFSPLLNLHPVFKQYQNHILGCVGIVSTRGTCYLEACVTINLFFDAYIQGLLSKGGGKIEGPEKGISRVTNGQSPSTLRRLFIY